MKKNDNAGLAAGDTDTTVVPADAAPHAKPKDGGPAFPQSVMADHQGGFHCSYDFVDGEGISVRDYFAAKAMPEILQIAVQKFPFEAPSSIREERMAAVARDAYGIADAMLKEREK